jgi:hypothetical protein
MDRLLDVVGIFSIAIITLVLVSVRRAHIRVEYSVSWLSAGIIMLVISRNGYLVQRLSDILGIGYAPLALLFSVFCVFLVVFYRFSIRISDLKDANIALAQRLAILEYQIRIHEEDQQTQPSR